MDFNTVVLAQLQSILESQSAVMESQRHLANTIETFQERLQGADFRSKSSQREVARHTTQEGEYISSSSTLKGDVGWPGNVVARYVSDSRTVVPAHTRASRCSVWEEPDAFHSFADTCCVILPDSKKQMFLDFASVLFVLWDLTTTSFFLSWDVEYTGIFWVGICVTPPFWTLDIVKHFCMAFYHDDALVTRKIPIAKSYLKSYFLIDLFVVIFDWSFLAFLTADQSGDRAVALLRAMKLIKLIRILELLRMSSRLLGRWNLYAERRFSELSQLVMSMVVPTLYILWCMHFLACLFYAVGSAKLGNGGRSWFRGLDEPDVGIEFENSPLINQYLAAYHWTIATISCAGNFEAPVTNPSERGVMIFTLVLGFIFGSVFISFLSAAIVDYEMKRNAKSSSLRDLRRYLAENQVCLATYQRVVKHAEKRLRTSDRLKEGDVDALSHLSRSLITDLRLEIQWPPLRCHPLFHLYELLDEDLPRRFCNDVLSSTDLYVGDELFKECDLAEAAHILTSGLLQYVQAPQTSKVANLTQTDVGPGSWLSEAALFSLWMHVGNAYAKLSSRLLIINATALSKTILRRDPVIHAIAIEYGREFHRRITLSSPPNAWPNDLVVPSTDYCDIVLSLPLQCQIEIGKCAIREIHHSRAADLVNELTSAKAVIILTSNCEVYRIKSIVVLRVQDEDGASLLAQIGKVEGGVVTPSVMLPACTLEKGELVSGWLARRLKDKFAFLDGKIEVIQTHRAVIESESKEFGIQTRYYRDEVFATFCDGHNIDLPGVKVKAAVQPSRSHTQKLAPSANFRRYTSMAAGRTASAVRFESEVRALIHWSDEENATIYSWLSKPEFDYLQSHSGTEWLGTCLKTCKFEPPASTELLI